MEIVYEEVVKSSQNLEINDAIRVGGVYCRIERIVTNHHDELVLHLVITGATVKQRSKMMLILPKKIPICTLE
jgi:hypothetical protein